PANYATSPRWRQSPLRIGADHHPAPPPRGEGSRVGAAPISGAPRSKGTYAMGFLLRRLTFYLAAFLAAATINFFLPRLMPGDPIQIMFASAGSELSLENLNALKLTFGFIDAPLHEQYFSYLKSVFTGDLGRSIKFFPLPVTDLLMRALVWTVGLMGLATILSFTLGTFL